MENAKLVKTLFRSLLRILRKPMAPVESRLIMPFVQQISSIHDRYDATSPVLSAKWNDLPQLLRKEFDRGKNSSEPESIDACFTLMRELNDVMGVLEDYRDQREEKRNTDGVSFRLGYCV